MRMFRELLSLGLATGVVITFNGLGRVITNGEVFDPVPVFFGLIGVAVGLLAWRGVDKLFEVGESQ